MGAELYNHCHKLLRDLDTLKRFQSGKCWPQHIIMAPEAACQLLCPFCTFKNRDTTQRVAWEAAEAFIRLAAQRGTTALEYSGGEPTLWQPIAQAVRLAHELGIQQAILTNGLSLGRLSRDEVGMLAWLRVSLNGIEQGKPTPDLDIPPHVFRSGSFIWHEGSMAGSLQWAVEWCRRHGCKCRVVPDGWLHPQSPARRRMAEAVAACGGDAYPILSDDRKPPVGCYYPWIKPMLGWDGYLYACCYGGAFDWDHDIPACYRVCHINEVDKWYQTHQVKDMGHRCSNCPGWQTNELLHLVHTTVTHGAFK